MIHEFNKKLVFPPMRWLNSVARWCLGVHSSDGSIKVTNTADPSSDGSLDLCVNKGVITAQVNEKLESLSLTKLQREQVTSLVKNLCDNFTILTEGGIAVNQNWLKDTVNDLLTQIHSPSSETGTPTEHIDDGSGDDYQDGSSWEWNADTSDDGNGLKLDCYYGVEEIDGYHYLSRCTLTFSKAGLLIKATGVTGRKEIEA